MWASEYYGRWTWRIFYWIIHLYCVTRKWLTSIKPWKNSVQYAYDSWANPKDAKKLFGIDLITETGQLSSVYETIVLCVDHNEFKTLNLDKLKKEKSVIFDVKECLDKEIVDDRL